MWGLCHGPKQLPNCIDTGFLLISVATSEEPLSHPSKERGRAYRCWGLFMDVVFWVFCHWKTVAIAYSCSLLGSNTSCGSGVLGTTGNVCGTV